MKTASDTLTGRPLRRTLTRRDLVKAGTAAGLLLAVRCTGAQTSPAAATVSPGAVSPGKVTWLVSSLGNERFDPAFTVGGTGHDYALQTHGFLVTYDIVDGRKVLSPGIASKWVVSADGKTWTFTIRKGAKFHDGTEVTAEDVVWSFQHVFGVEARGYVINSGVKSTSALIDRIALAGPDAVSVTTTRPVGDLFTTISEASPIWQGVVMPRRTTLHDVAAEEAYDRSPVGAGMMKLVSHTHGQSMTFERFADYYRQPQYGSPTDKRPRFTSLDLRVAPEEASRVAALQAGQADIAAVSAGARKQIEAGGGRIAFGQEAAFVQISINGAWRPEFPISDKRVRQALNYAIDKELMRNQLFGPESMTLKGWFFATPSTIGYSTALDPVPFDADKARQLLADAGYPGGKGFGRLILNTWQSAAIPQLPDSAQLGAQMWRTVLGLDVEVRLGEQVATNALGDAGKLQGQILWRDAGTRLDPASTLRAYFGDPARADRLHSSPELFDLVAAAQAVVDPAQREQVLSSLYRRLRDEWYVVSLGYLNVAFGVGPRVLTFQPEPLVPYSSGLYSITLK